MSNEEILKDNNNKKFDICLMNPPYGDSNNGGMNLDLKFLWKLSKLSNKCVSIQPANRFVSKTNMADEVMEADSFKEIEILNAKEIFNINTSWKYVGIFIIDNLNTYNNIIVHNKLKNETIKINKDRESRENLYKVINTSSKLLNIINKLKPLYDQLIKNYGTMVNDGDDYIYEANRLKSRGQRWGVTKEDQKSLSRVKEYLKTGKYKYCIYKGSFNHSYDKPQEWLNEDPDKLFKGQICWLTNKKNIKNNIIYWMECPLFDLWRKFYFGDRGDASCCTYGLVPAVDFNKNENDFKQYIDNLVEFNEDEIKVLQEFNVHNIINKKDKGKRFDIILSNPPYDRNLHLKFLEKYIQLADKVISIQPVRWLEDPFAKTKTGADYNKYNESIYKHIHSLEKIDKDQANKDFGIGLTMNIGIYLCDEIGGYSNENSDLINKIVEKTQANSWDQFNCKKMEGKEQKKYIIRTTGIAGGKQPLMCNTYERQLQVKPPNPKSHNANNCAIFSFDTEEERRNFYDCYTTKFIKWHCSLWKKDLNANTKNVPYFNDYTKHWTNKDFYEYFELTEEEIKQIEDEMSNL